METAVTWTFQDAAVSSHSNTLLVGLNELRSKGLLLDITFQTEGKKFKAHRAVLSACSDYFRAMFTDPMKESQQSEVSLNGVTATGIELLLDYAYTSKLKLNTDNVQEVLSGATHFQMDAVVNACSNYLDSQLDIENCVDIVTIAETYSLLTLKKRVYRFICGHLHEFSKTSEFYRLACHQLEHILSCDLPVDCTETIVLKIVLQWINIAGDGLDKDPKNFTRLLHHVRLAVIPYAELERILINASLSSSTSSDIVHYVTKNILDTRKLVASSTKEIVTESIVNIRGMELALIKIGGFGLSGITNKITYFLPSTKKWLYLTSIPHVDQCNYGTEVYQNELYVVGGCYNDSLEEYIHPFGFRYSPMLNKWTTIAPMLQDRCRFSLNFVGDFLYAVGGASDNSNLDEDDEEEEASAERYNPATDTWEIIPSLPGYRSQHAGAAHGHYLYISGGLESQVVLATFCRFNTKYGFWEQLSPMTSPRADHVMLTIDNKLYVCGGWYEIPGTTIRVLNDTIDVYDTVTRIWEIVTFIPTPRYHAGIVSVHSKIYIIGGLYSASLVDRATSIIECYDLETNEWSNLENFPINIWEHSCASLYLQKCNDDIVHI